MDVRTPIPTNYGYFQTQFADAWKSQAEQLKKTFGDKIEQILMPPLDATDILTVYVKKEAILDVLKYLKDENGFEYSFLSDITATDESPDEPRFHVVYHLFSVVRKWRIRIKTKIRENEEALSAVEIWAGANWQEREVWDMFGIKFKGHPDLRRILMDLRWEGHPLRKDYPLRGYQVFSQPEDIDAKLLD